MRASRALFMSSRQRIAAVVATTTALRTHTYIASLAHVRTCYASRACAATAYTAIDTPARCASTKTATPHVVDTGRKPPPPRIELNSWALAEEWAALVQRLARVRAWRGRGLAHVKPGASSSTTVNGGDPIEAVDPAPIEAAQHAAAERAAQAFTRLHRSVWLAPADVADAMGLVRNETFCYPQLYALFFACGAAGVSVHWGDVYAAAAEAEPVHLHVVVTLLAGRRQWCIARGETILDDVEVSFLRALAQPRPVSRSPRRRQSVKGRHPGYQGTPAAAAAAPHALLLALGHDYRRALMARVHASKKQSRAKPASASLDGLVKVYLTELLEPAVAGAAQETAPASRPPSPRPGADAAHHLRQAVFHYLGGCLQLELRGLLLPVQPSATSPQGAMRSARALPPRKEVSTQLRVVQDYVQQCVRVLQAPRTTASQAARQEAVRAIAECAELALDVQLARLDFDGLLPSTWTTDIASFTTEVLQLTFGAVEAEAELFPALCQPSLIARVETLRRPRAGRESSRGADGDAELYVAASHGLLSAARVFYVQHPSRAAHLAITQLKDQNPHLSEILAQSLLPTTTRAHVNLAVHLHGVALLVAAMMATGLSPDTVVESGLCVALSPVEAVDVEMVFGIFSPSSASSSGAARETFTPTPPRLRSAVAHGVVQTLEACALAIRRMVVTPTQLLEARLHSTTPTAAGGYTGQTIVPAVVRGSAHLASHPALNSDKATAAHASTRQFSASGAMPFDVVRGHVEASLHLGLRALVQSVCRGDKELAMGILSRLTPLLNFYGTQESFVLHAELLSLIRAGVAQTLIAMGRGDPNCVALLWRRRGLRLFSHSDEAKAAGIWCTTVATTTPAVERVLEAVAVFLLPRLADSIARAERRPQPPTRSHAQTAGTHTGQRAVVAVDDGGAADLADAVVVERHLAAVLRLTADVAVLGCAASVTRQLVALHQTLLTAREKVAAHGAHRTSLPSDMVKQIAALQAMLTETRRGCLPVLRHESTLSLHASHVMLHSVLAVHLTAVWDHLTSTPGYVTSASPKAVQDAASTLDERAGPTTVLFAAVHLVYTAGTHFPVSAEVNTMRRVRVTWLSPALVLPLDHLHRHVEYVSAALSTLIPQRPRAMPNNTAVVASAAITLAMLCEVAAVTCTAATVSALPRALYNSFWDTTEDRAKGWRWYAQNDTHGKDAQLHLQRETLFKAQLAQMVCTLTAVFGLSTDNGTACQARFVLGLARVIDLLDLSGVVQLVHAVFGDGDGSGSRATEVTTPQSATALSQTAQCLNAALVELATPRSPTVAKPTKKRAKANRNAATPALPEAEPNAYTTAEVLAILDALTLCPSSGGAPPGSASPPAAQRKTDALITQMLTTLIISSRIPKSAAQASEDVDIDNGCNNAVRHVVAEMSIENVCELLRICIRQRRHQASAAPASRALLTAFTAAAVDRVEARLNLSTAGSQRAAVSSSPSLAPAPSSPLTSAELCAVVDSFSRLAGAEDEDDADTDGLREAVLRAAVGPLMRVVPTLAPEPLVTVMEAYARAGVSHEALWMLLTARVVAVGALVSLPSSGRLVHIAMGAPPMDKTTPSVRASCRAAVYPVFERQVRHVLQNDPHTLTSGTPVSQDIFTCLLTCFAAEPVSGAVLESLAAQPERLSVSVMAAALQLAAARVTEPGTQKVIDVLLQQCTAQLMPACGPRDLAVLTRGLVACNVRSGRLVAAVRDRLVELGGGAVDASTLAMLAKAVIALGAGAEDAALVDLFAADMKRVAQGEPRPTARELCALLQLCRVFGPARLGQVMPAADALLTCFTQSWQQQQQQQHQLQEQRGKGHRTKAESAAFMDGVSVRDLEVVLSACLNMASTPKAHQPLIALVANALQQHLTASPGTTTHVHGAAWRSDLLLSAQLLQTLAQLDARATVSGPVMRELCDVLYAQRRQLTRRPHVMQTVQQAMRLVGRDVHSDLFALVMDR